MSRTFDMMQRYSARYIDRPLLALPLPVQVHRLLFDLQARLATHRPMLPTRWRTIGGVRTRISRPKGARGRILWLHGGGFVLGSPDTHAALTDHLALATGMEVWCPRYRLAPEHPWPAAVNDCISVARAIADTTGRPLHLGGDSAGGNLALMVLRDAVERNMPPQSVTLISPAVDLRADRADPDDDDEMLLPRAFLRRCRQAYLGDAPGTDPRQSPLTVPFPACPPVHIELARREVLEGDSNALIAHLRRGRTKVTVHREADVPHDYHVSAGRSDAANAGVRRIANHILGTTA
ncbi:alpha/beta hydrolase fold domain-containing protein [Jannaschia sp. 2305UL9-9]|uniref:alpha/beta hydrolase fold domain-containing protein n=1 Tax=Jannaschia sp. 2305UL9-9 TaxID=3121638 RepID=UPI00352995B9